MKQLSLIEAWDNLCVDPWHDDEYQVRGDLEKYDAIIQHHKAKLTLGDFIPCKDGKPLRKPLPESEWEKSCFTIEYCKKWKEEYQQALDRVVYEGFELNHIGEIWYFIGNGDMKIKFAIKDGFCIPFKTRADMAGFELTEQTYKRLYK
jgi:hypothetical protein